MALFGSNSARERLEDRVRGLEVKYDELDRGSRKLELEYIELYDKVSHQMSRMANRHTTKQKENGQDPLEDPQVEPDDGVDPISRSILARRGTRRPTQ